MVASAAFGELTAVLERLETSDAAVEHVAVDEQSIQSGGELTADLRVEVPLLSNVELGEGVTIEAENTDLRDQRVPVDLSVTVSVDDASPNRRFRTGTAGVDELADGQLASNDVPAYKDPDALAAVYERYDTFPEMTAALDTDVTSETVRRYMVQHDIHDPHAGPVRANGLNRSSDKTRGQDDADAEHANQRTTTAGDATVSTEPDQHSNGHGPTEASDDDSSPIGDRLVADILTDADGPEQDNALVADGLGIPSDITVAELAEVINDSNSIYAATERLGTSQSSTRRMLRELDLIQFVTHQLAADQIRVSHREVARRLDPDGS